MNHPWQQPIRPLEYWILPVNRTDPGNPFWFDVMFIRPTDDGFEVIGENGARWDARAIMIREVAP